jgi:hypothetical protein
MTEFIDDFYRRLDAEQEKNRIERIFKNRPANLHDYQGCENDPVHLRQRIANLEQTNFNLRRAYHNASAHNQFFERCEDPYCNPNPPLAAAFSSAGDTSMTPGDRAKVEYIDTLEEKVARLEAPVSDDEIFRHRSHATNGGFGHKDGLLDKDHINALIAARGGK